jgi:hypothetical protein
LEAQILPTWLVSRSRLHYGGHTKVTPLRRTTTEAQGGLTMRVTRRAQLMNLNGTKLRSELTAKDQKNWRGAMLQYK